jgi:PKD repeat protein
MPLFEFNYTKNNLVVNFDSTDQEDPNVIGLTYSWDFGDGQTANTASKTLSHNYSVAGTYNVSLTVTDAYGASDSENISIELVNGNSNLEICNGGQSPIKMSFGLSGLESFTLEHVYNYDENGWFTGSTCECKKLSVPANTNISIHVEGIYNLQVIPYDGMINVPANQSLYEIFTNGEMNYPPGYVGPQVFTIVRGVYYRVSCKNFVYK